jgi:Tfp pilus assembly protein FimT
MKGNLKMREEKGMSTTEVVVSLAIAGMLLLLLGSELQAMVARVNLDAAAAEIIGDLRYARTQAVWERQVIEVSIDEAQAVLSMARQSNPTQLIRPSRNLQSRGVLAIRSTGGTVLSFSPRGTSATATTLTLEGRNGEHRVITVSLTGIVRGR